MFLKRVRFMTCQKFVTYLPRDWCCHKKPCETTMILRGLNVPQQTNRDNQCCRQPLIIKKKKSLKVLFDSVGCQDM